MSFLSFNFAVFLGIALLLFHLGPVRWRPGVLLALSYAFYLTWSIAYTVLLIGVTAGVYVTAQWIEQRRTEAGKKASMALGVGALLVLLFGFKSAGWIWQELSRSPASGAAWIVVPLGLSYYVFKMLGYLLDVYWEVLPARRDFVAVALHGAFFPQLVSGPIQRAGSFFEQLDGIQSPQSGEFLVGLRRILFGLIKKIAIADQLATLAGHAHANPSAFSTLELLVAAYGFSIQLYMDFSGLTDIALGIGLLFGIKGPENFDLPYYAANIQAFWRRWHMSLTTWLTDYLFTPLRMSFRNLGTAGLCLAIFVNMVAIGLWHGITWTFLAFGLVNGLFMTVSVLTLKRRNSFFKAHPGLARLRAFAAPLLTFHLVVLTHILFRAESPSSAVTYLSGLIPGLTNQPFSGFRFDLAALGTNASTLALCVTAFFGSEVVTWAARRPAWTARFLAMPAIVRQATYAALVMVVLLLFKETVTFIYAQF